MTLETILIRATSIGVAIFVAMTAITFINDKFAAMAAAFN